MTKKEKEKLNTLYNRVVNNCGVFIMSDEWYRETSYEKAYLEFNRRLNHLREIEEHLYTPYNLGYYGILGTSDGKFYDFISKLRSTNNLLGVGKTVDIEDRPKNKNDKINDIKRMLPLNEEEFDNIKEGTYAYYLSELDSKYRFTKLEKLYLMEYLLLKCEGDDRK